MLDFCTVLKVQCLMFYLFRQTRIRAEMAANMKTASNCLGSTSLEKSSCFTEIKIMCLLCITVLRPLSLSLSKYTGALNWWSQFSIVIGQSREGGGGFN